MAPSSLRALARRPIAWAGLAALLIVVGLAACLWPLWFSPDLAAAQRANNRGIGHMEQFDYGAAVPAFQEAVRLAPGWLPGRINLGIALMNRHGSEETSLAPDWLPTRIKNAVARVTRKKKEDLECATQIFQRVLEEDPENPYAHFCLGHIFHEQQLSSKAIVHFQSVTRLDPSDAHAWYWLGICLPESSPSQQECFERAVQLNPNLSPALHALALKLQATNPNRAKALLAEIADLQAARWDQKAGRHYGEMGRYACVVAEE